jgi:hypothetical protein
MHPIIWLLILFPPCLAFYIWKFGGVGNRTKDITVTGGFKADVWQRVSLGKYGYWIILTILYTVMFAAAAFEHKL